MSPIKDYSNYIVARPTPTLECHSEVEIFGDLTGINSCRFKTLWRAYVQDKRVYHAPSVLADLTLESLSESPYNEAITFVGYTIVWPKENKMQHEQSIEKLTKKGMFVGMVDYDKYLPRQSIPLHFEFIKVPQILIMV